MPSPYFYGIYFEPFLVGFLKHIDLVNFLILSFPLIWIIPHVYKIAKEVYHNPPLTGGAEGVGAHRFGAIFFFFWMTLLLWAIGALAIILGIFLLKLLFG